MFIKWIRGHGAEDRRTRRSSKDQLYVEDYFHIITCVLCALFDNAKYFFEISNLTRFSQVPDTC